MEYIRFNPKTHKAAFAKGHLYEWQSEIKKNSIVGRWVKVTKKSVYEDALSNPIFFAVAKGLAETTKEATESFVWGEGDESIRIIIKEKE